MRKWHKVGIIILVSLALFVFVAPKWVNVGIERTNVYLKLEIPRIPEVPFRLGLDLLGGTHLVYRADFSALDADVNRSDAMEGVRDVIERRVNFFGVAEPLVQVSGEDRLIVELAGISDVSQAIELIGATPFLEFREEGPETQAIIEAQQRGERLDEDPLIATGLNGNHLDRAQVTFDQQTGTPEVSLELTDEGAELFADVTRRNLGKIVGIYLDGMAISLPVVQSEITGGHAVITGRFTAQEAKQLATRMNSGALPVPITLISQETVDATLGTESLQKSTMAGLIGFMLVIIFMIAFYRLPGVVAVAAMFFYVLVVLSAYKAFPVTLTLAGIAGFILSLGMAVDANILIFARMREELVAGKTLSQSVNEGFRRAWLSIRDGHMTTLIGAFVLYAFTTSIVKGFALTLGIGVLTSLFTAVFVTKVFLSLFIGPKFEKRKWLFR